MDRARGWSRGLRDQSPAWLPPKDAEDGVDDSADSAEALPSARWNSPRKAFGPAFCASSNRTVLADFQTGKRDGWRSGIASGRLLVLASQATEFVAVGGGFDDPESAHQLMEIIAIEFSVGLPLH